MSKNRSKMRKNAKHQQQKNHEKLTNRGHDLLYLAIRLKPDSFYK